MLDLLVPEPPVVIARDVEAGQQHRWEKFQLRREAVMKKWLRRVRGAIGMGLTWAIAWFGAGMALLLVVGFGAADVPFPLFFGVLGFLVDLTPNI